MIVTVRTTNSSSLEFIRDISSFILYDLFGSPAVIGLEYAMPEGTAWTLSAAEDRDFFKILSTSGILHTEIEGCHFGTANLLCTPLLGQGVPRWFSAVDIFSAATSDTNPFYLAYQTPDGSFQNVYYSDHEFKDRINSLWNRRQ